MKLVAKDVCVDLGTSSTLIYVKNKDIVLKEPSVVAINNITDEILAVGNDAKEMLRAYSQKYSCYKAIKIWSYCKLLWSKKNVRSLYAKCNSAKYV
jgi:actin-like ATPase involved in cell morphogenesis